MEENQSLTTQEQQQDNSQIEKVDATVDNTQLTQFEQDTQILDAKVKELSNNSFLISPQEFQRNYAYGMSEGSKYVERKNKFDYMPWGFVMRFLKSFHPNLEVRFVEDDLIRNNSELDRLPVTGNAKNGYCVRPYLRDRESGLTTPELFYQVTDFSNKVITNNLTSSDINSARMRGIVKLVAIHLGMGLHLYMGLGDVFNEKSKATEADVAAAEEAQQEQEQKEEVVQKILDTKEALMDEELDDYVDKSFIKDLKRATLIEKDLDVLEEIRNQKRHYLGVCKNLYYLDKYKEVTGEDHEQAETDLESCTIKQLGKIAKQLKADIAEQESPGTE